MREEHELEGFGNKRSGLTGSNLKLMHVTLYETCTLYTPGNLLTLVANSSSWFSVRCVRRGVCTLSTSLYTLR